MLLVLHILNSNVERAVWFYQCWPCNASQVWEGDGVVKSARKLIGATNPLEAEAGTIRGDFAIQTGRNVVHGSDSPENGVREASKQTSFVHVPQCDAPC